jgi:glycosyltransferase involved in cell wall biosynthesis
MRAPMVCLVVPNGTHRPDALARAIVDQHPTWRMEVLWAGDPHQQPSGSGVVSMTAASDLVADWELVQLRCPGEAAEWIAALEAARRHVAAGSCALLLWVGSAAVLGSLDALVPRDGTDAVLIPRMGAAMPPDDDQWPSARDLVDRGAICTAAASFGASADGLVAAMAKAIRSGVLPARALEIASLTTGVQMCADPAIGVGPWRWDVESPAFLDLTGFDPERPWVLDPNVERPARFEVVEHPTRAAALAAAAPQVAGRRCSVSLPGGIPIDQLLVSLVRSDPSAPDGPWSDPGPFRRWLAPRYWAALHDGRQDLVSAFPEPQGASAGPWSTWMRRASFDDVVPLMVEPRSASRAFEVSPVLTPGVNVVGYHSRRSGVGLVAAELHRLFTDGGVSSTAIDYDRSSSPVIGEGWTASPRVDHDTTVAVVTADQFPVLRSDHPELFFATSRMIGYWFWELETVPASMRRAMRLVDEVWACSTFITDALRRGGSVTVHHVPIPVPRPVSSDRERASFPPLADVGDRPVFGVVLDHFSVTARKNPIGAIRAFTQAFRPDEGPVLVIKTMNGDHRWPQHQEVVAAANGRPDIRVWDAHLARADHMAFIRSLDVLVSLHRSEGLGLHLAEAMWLGTPVIATRYSGNLDFMDDACSILVDAGMVHVEGGEGVYPAEAMWADPDIDQAAAAMRRLVDDEHGRTSLAQAALARMEAQPVAEMAARVAALIDQRVAS